MKIKKLLRILNKLPGEFDIVVKPDSGSIESDRAVGGVIIDIGWNYGKIILVTSNQIERNKNV